MPNDDDSLPVPSQITPQNEHILASSVVDELLLHADISNGGGETRCKYSTNGVCHDDAGVGVVDIDTDTAVSGWKEGEEEEICTDNQIFAISRHV